MPKPVLATAQDLKDAEAKLTSEIQRVQSLIEPTVNQGVGALKPAIQAVDQKITQSNQLSKQEFEKTQREGKDYTNESCKALHMQILPLFPPIEAAIVKQGKEQSQNLNTVNETLQKMMKSELQALCSKFDEEIISLRAEMNGNLQTWATEAAEALVDQRKQIDAAIAELTIKSDNDDQRDRDALSVALEEFREMQIAKDTTQDEKAQRAQGEIYVKMGLLDEKITEAMRLLDAETKETHTLHVAEYASFLDKTEAHFGVLDDDTRSLRNAMSEVENVPTRKVDWVIKDISMRLRPLTPSSTMLHTSWFSPKFDAAGAHGLQLELQLFRSSDPPVDGEDAGDVAVHLWACKGMQMSYKLSCGRKTAPVLEKTFNGRVPYGTKRYWFLGQQINKEDDTLTVSVEILEAIREVEHTIKAPPPAIEDPDAPPKTLEQLCVEAEIADKALDGSIFFQRVTNNRLYDQVKSQVDIMQSRMVRKIEWRVECASLLRRCFPPNECLCSAAFDAAGIAGMQFVFYPSGYKGCTEGYCSLFLYGPAGATLKCFLAAGSQRREASHSFDEPGAFGRTNFCRYESCVDDADDSILMVLEIEDAQQDWTANIKHPALQPGDRRNIQQVDGTSDKPIESIVKLTKKPGQRQSGKDAALLELKVLPSLWTAKQLGATSSAPDGMSNFDELRAKAKGGPAGGGSRMKSQFSMGNSTMQGSGMMHATSSMPTMPTMGDSLMQRSAMTEDLSSGPSQFAQTAGQSRDFATVKKAGPRGPRPRANMGASMTAM